MHSTLGQHSVVELYECDPSFLRRVAKVKEVLVMAAKHCKATIIEVVFHEFNPFGVSGMVIIAESHLAIHTWPEYRYAAVDIFTCGESLIPDQAAAYIAREFHSSWWQIYRLPRGRFDAAKQPLRDQLPIVFEDRTREENLVTLPSNLSKASALTANKVSQNL